MEIELSAKDHGRLSILARRSGRAESEIVCAVLESYLDGMDEVRQLLADRVIDIENGSAPLLTEEELLSNLARRKEAFRRQGA